MSISRRALLISNPGETGAENYCKGVYVDVKNYQHLLMSDVGGAWDADHIKHLDRPTVQVVRLWLDNLAPHDYTFVMFTGHGWYSGSDRDRILEFREKEEMASFELFRGARQRTVILDCCQRVHPESLSEKSAALSTFSAIEARHAPNRDTCRRLFFDAIQNAPTGILRTVSCAIGEVSTDDETRGGRYNGSVFECVDDWAQAQAKTLDSRTAPVFSVVAAHECAANKTRKLSANQQNPTIEKQKTGPYFPIAVFG